MEAVIPNLRRDQEMPLTEKEITSPMNLEADRLQINSEVVEERLEKKKIISLVDSVDPHLEEKAIISLVDLEIHDNREIDLEMNPIGINSPVVPVLVGDLVVAVELDAGTSKMITMKGISIIKKAWFSSQEVMEWLVILVFHNIYFVFCRAM